MIVVGVVLSFGPVFHPSAGSSLPSLDPMPYTILFNDLPGFAALRVPSRFAALVIFGLAILAGDGLAFLIDWLAQRRPAFGPLPTARRSGSPVWSSRSSRARQSCQPLRSALARTCHRCISGWPNSRGPVRSLSYPSTRTPLSRVRARTTLPTIISPSSMDFAPSIRQPTDRSSPTSRPFPPGRLSPP